MMSSQFALPLDSATIENPAYLTDQLITYIGNKRALLALIGAGTHRARALLGLDKVRFLDLFAGSGIVSRYAKRFSKHIIANDIEPYSVAANRCFLSNASEVDRPGLERSLNRIIERQDKDPQPGFLTKLYAPADEQYIASTDRVFYTRRNAAFLDSACRSLEGVERSVRDLLLGPLLSAASIHANTSGVFKGFYKDDTGKGKYGGSAGDALKRILQPIEWRLPVLSNFNCSYEVHNIDANILVRDLDHVDVAYFDPPYNQHPYGSNYFMLNLLADYQEPTDISRVSGIPTKWQRSEYNRRAQSERVLFDAIEHCSSDIILISYSSEGFIPLDTFHRNLRNFGSLEVFDTTYNTFRGCRNLHGRDHLLKEFLFLLDKR